MLLTSLYPNPHEPPWKTHAQTLTGAHTHTHTSLMSVISWRCSRAMSKKMLMRVEKLQQEPGQLRVRAWRLLPQAWPRASNLHSFLIYNHRSYLLRLLRRLNDQTLGKKLEHCLPHRHKWKDSERVFPITVSCVGGKPWDKERQDCMQVLTRRLGNSRRWSWARVPGADVTGPPSQGHTYEHSRKPWHVCTNASFPCLTHSVPSLHSCKYVNILDTDTLKEIGNHNLDTVYFILSLRVKIQIVL